MYFKTNNMFIVIDKFKYLLFKYVIFNDNAI